MCTLKLPGKGPSIWRGAQLILVRFQLGIYQVCLCMSFSTERKMAILNRLKVEVVGEKKAAKKEDKIKLY